MRNAATAAWPVAALAVGVLVLQRLGAPISSFTLPFSALLALLAMVRMTLAGRWIVDPLRLLLLLGFVIAALVGIVGRGGDEAVLTAFAYVLLLWTPAIAVAGSRREATEFSERFIRATVITTAAAGGFGAVQSLVSLSTGFFLDPLALIPGRWQVPGYRAAQSITYGGSWMKANGGIFLEPAFLSLFSALALVLVVAGAAKFARAQRILCITLLISGLASSAAISGLVVLPVLLISALGTAQRFVRTMLTMVSIAALAVFTPIATPLLNRLLYADGSNDARLVRPYEQILPLWWSGPVALGFGPGSSRDVADELTAGSWQNEVTTPTVVKLFYEYGLVGGSLWFALLAVLLLCSSAQLAVRVAFAVALIVPTDGLTSHVLVPVVVFVFMGSSASRLADSSASTLSPSRVPQIT